ncbi:hypothetical protein CRG98_030319 [Punica granatum]|uniref:Uncharacterized protein n=1 Tax=Punica granatum TaxID=22663 RepID=A0A2I0J0Q9_PUNGR|nr:hypothetical protein CRG98_030319 [Punica granatum]
MQKSKLARVSRPGMVARGTSEVARRTCGAGKLQEARARWLDELAVQESKLARVSRPGKVARGTSEVARRTCGVGKLQEARARWHDELAVQESKLARVSRPGEVAEKKVTSHELADPASLQEARARWLSEPALKENPTRLQKSNLARVSRPGKFARGTSEVAQRTCVEGKKVTSHELADPASLQEARARWLSEPALKESKLARVSRPGKVARKTRQGCKRPERGGSTNLRCSKVRSHGLADPARLYEARVRWLGEPAVKESKLAWISRPGKVARGPSEVAQRTCGAAK